MVAMNLLIHNAEIFTNDKKNTLLAGQAAVIAGSRIIEIGEASAMRKKHPEAERLDGRGRLLMPGLINAHMHFYGTYARGLALKGTPKNFHEILQMLWWKLDSALDAEAVYFSALIPAITAVKKGVTAVIDHHASPNAVEGSLDRIEAALALAGLRGILCYEVSDRDGQEISRKGLQENERYIRKCRSEKQKNPDHLFDAMMGLHASFTLDDDSLQQAGEISRTLQRGCHIHLLEDEVDYQLTQEKYHANLIDRLCEYGILGPQSIAAHGIHLTESEKDILAQTGAMVAHNPQSNMNNAVGRTDIFGLLKRGVLAGIGSDGMSADLRPDIRAAHLLHKHDLKNSNLGWQEIQQMALKNNPEIYRRISGQPVGKIAPGYLADLILIDYDPPTPMAPENFWGHFLFGIADAPVNTTIVNGRIVMQNGELPGIDEAKIAAESRKVAERVWNRFQS